jgi:hypothetical protein
MAEGEEFRTKPFQFSTPRQERIYGRLRKVGPGPAAFYKDACRHMTEQPLYESTTHLVAHLLREIESGLRQVLVTASSEVVLKGEKDEQVLTMKFPSVVVEIGEPAFELLCDVLENAILLSRPLGRPRHPEDLSNIWCSSIEIDSGVHIDGKPLLVSAIRDAADLLANADPQSVSRLVKSLRKRRRLIFRRLAHHLLRLHPQSDMVDVERTLLSRGMLDPSRRSEWDEYSMLMRDCFKLLSQEKQHKIVKWIDEGPNLARFTKRFERAHGQAPTDEQIQQVVQIWKKKRLDLISKDLSDKLKSEFASLVAISTAHDETKTSPEGLGGAWMHSAPLKAKEIEALSIDEIVKFLNTWESTGDWGFPTEEGLGATLSHVIAEQPERFAQGAPHFQGVRAIYVNAIVEGFQEAIPKNQRFDWPPLIELLKWAVQQQSNAPPQNGIANEWYWTRNSIATGSTAV